MKKCALILILLFMIGPAYAASNFDFSGYIENQSGIRIRDFGGGLFKEKNIVGLSAEYKLKDDLVFFTKAKYWYDAMYDWREKYDIDQHYMGHVQRADWLRDCYLDYNHGPWFLRLGKQQVAWGQADGVTILDRVNPVDLSEYWLPDMVDIRIPLWMVNINYSPKLNSNLQLLVIPDFEQSEAAAPYSPFAFRSANIFANLNKSLGYPFIVNTRLPAKKFENSTFGLQWSDRIGDLNYTLNYLNGYYYSARTFIVGYNVMRTFKNWRMYGSSFNKTFTNPGPLQGITLRGDFAYYNDEPTYVGDPVAGSTKNVKRWDNIFWLVGVDKYLFTKLQMSFQFSQYIMEHGKDKASNRPVTQQYPMNAYTYGPADAVENIFTLKFSSSLMNDRFKPEVLWSLTDDNQGKISPKMSYEINDNLWLTAGVHYFYGHAWDSNGQFKDMSEFYTNLKFTF